MCNWVSMTGFGLFKNRVPIWTLKFDFGIDSLLSKGGGVVSMKRGVYCEMEL